MLCATASGGASDSAVAPAFADLGALAAAEAGAALASGLPRGSSSTVDVSGAGADACGSGALCAIFAEAGLALAGEAFAAAGAAAATPGFATWAACSFGRGLAGVGVVHSSAEAISAWSDT